jgi:hypothetical protein
MFDTYSTSFLFFCRVRGVESGIKNSIKRAVKVVGTMEINLLNVSKALNEPRPNPNDFVRRRMILQKVDNTFIPHGYFDLFLP